MTRWRGVYRRRKATRLRGRRPRKMAPPRAWTKRCVSAFSPHFDPPSPIPFLSPSLPPPLSPCATPSLPPQLSPSVCEALLPSPTPSLRCTPPYTPSLGLPGTLSGLLLSSPPPPPHRNQIGGSGDLIGPDGVESASFPRASVRRIRMSITEVSSTSRISTWREGSLFSLFHFIFRAGS